LEPGIENWNEHRLAMIIPPRLITYEEARHELEHWASQEE
jgi:hypothetical protein